MYRHYRCYSTDRAWVKVRIDSGAVYAHLYHTIILLCRFGLNLARYQGYCAHESYITQKVTFKKKIF